MGITKYKPTSAGRRFMTSADYDEIIEGFRNPLREDR